MDLPNKRPPNLRASRPLSIQSISQTALLTSPINKFTPNKTDSQHEYKFSQHFRRKYDNSRDQCKNIRTNDMVYQTQYKYQVLIDQCSSQLLQSPTHTLSNNFNNNTQHTLPSVSCTQAIYEECTPLPSILDPSSLLSTIHSIRSINSPSSSPLSQRYLSLWQTLANTRYDTLLLKLTQPKIKTIIRDNILQTMLLLFLLQLFTLLQQNNARYSLNPQETLFLYNAPKHLSNYYLCLSQFLLQKFSVDLKDVSRIQISTQYRNMELITLNNTNPLSISKKQSVFIKNIIEIIIKALQQDNDKIIKNSYIKQIINVVEQLLNNNHNIQIAQLNRNLLSLQTNVINIFEKQLTEDQCLAILFKMNITQNIKIESFNNTLSKDFNNTMTAQKYQNSQIFNQKLHKYNSRKNVDLKKYKLIINARCLFMETDNEFQIRPFINILIENANQYYEIILINNDDQDVNEFIKKKLVSEVKMVYLEDKDDQQYFEQIDFDPTKTVLVDYDEVTYQSYQENGVCISKWQGNKSDNILKYLAKILIKIQSIDFQDIRRVLKTVRHQSLRNKMILQQR